MGRRRPGFTLIEMLIGAAMLTVAIAALFGAFLGQSILNEHARNLTWAMNDANRVMEQLRLNNMTACVTPTELPVGFGNWDLWLANVGKSIPGTEELVTVTCRSQAGAWPCAAADDPKELTVAVCWRHRGRVIGECTWNGVNLVANPGAAGGVSATVTESPAMLSTLMTCRR